MCEKVCVCALHFVCLRVSVCALISRVRVVPCTLCVTVSETVFASV